MATRRQVAFDDTFGMGGTEQGDFYAPPQTSLWQGPPGTPPLPPGQPPPFQPDPSPAPAPTPGAKLYGTLDQGKLDAARGGGQDSAKYEFLSAAEKSGGYDPASVLAGLQQSNPTRWGGWSASGDKIRYGGSNLDPVFNNLKEFDVLHDFDNPNGPAGWGWQDTSNPGAMGLGATPGAGGPQGGSSGPVDIKAELAKLFPGGLFNQDVVNRRTENAAEALGRQRKSRVASNRAELADRGLIGSGPEHSAMDSMEDDLYNQYTNAVSGIYADESQNADARMMQAMGLYSDLDQADLDRMVDWFTAQTGRYGAETDRTLGLGNLALGNTRAANDYNLGLGQFGLDRDRLLADIDAGDMDRYIKLLELLLSGAGVSAGGYF